MAAYPDIDPIQFLPFVRSRKKQRGRDFWHAPSTGDDARDRALGAGMAQSALTFIARNPKFDLLSLIIHSMVKHGRYGGIEFGFLSAIGLALGEGLIAQNLENGN